MINFDRLAPRGDFAIKLKRQWIDDVLQITAAQFRGRGISPLRQHRKIFVADDSEVDRTWRPEQVGNDIEMSRPFTGCIGFRRILFLGG